ncbi:MAG TPA: nickel-dependent hydrogenase, b-type cytochrome subunit/YceI-like family protein, partial [Hyphomonas sp.]|nr:nickel-dependent hydrogenase, b-type cytochrome subunit/YceI-like family protein [Hyphomonas sp.]
MKTETSRYTIVAITLHWVMAALLLFMIWLGWNMDGNEARYQLHKSIGITLLFLT